MAAVRALRGILIKGSSILFLCCLLSAFGIVCGANQVCVWWTFLPLFMLIAAALLFSTARLEHRAQPLSKTFLSAAFSTVPALEPDPDLCEKIGVEQEDVAAPFHLRQGSKKLPLPRATVRSLRIIFVITSVLPAVMYMYTEHRARCDPPPLATYSGSPVIFDGTLMRIEEQQFSRLYVVQADALVYPANCAVHGMANVFPGKRWNEDGLHEGVRIRIQGRLDRSFGQMRWRPSAARPVRCFAQNIVPLNTLQPVNGNCLAKLAAYTDKARTCIASVHAGNLGLQLGSLLTSMVLGDKAIRLDQELIHEFRDVGLSHILAASGFNLTIVTAMTFFVMRLLFPSRAVVHTFCFASMIWFVLLAGASASVNRAAFMCTLILLIKGRHLQPDLLGVLSAAFLGTIAYDPFSLVDVGFQLSYAATAGILLLTKPLVALLSGSSERRLRKWLAEAVGVVLASQSAVLPIQLLHFQRLGLLFLPANLVVTPIVAPVTVIGFATSLIGGIGSNNEAIDIMLKNTAKLGDLLCLLPLKFMVFAVHQMALADWAKLHCARPSILILSVYGVAWAAFALSLHAQRLRRLGFALYLASCLMLVQPHSTDHRRSIANSKQPGASATGRFDWAAPTTDRRNN